MRRQWETEDLTDQWTLHAEERALLGNKTGATRLGFAVLLKYLRANWTLSSAEERGAKDGNYLSRHTGRCECGYLFAV